MLAVVCNAGILPLTRQEFVGMNLKSWAQAFDPWPVG